MPLLSKKVLIVLVLCTIAVVVLYLILGITLRKDINSPKNHTNTTTTTTAITTMTQTTTPAGEWTTTHSSALTRTSPMWCPAVYCPELHYYEAIAIRANVTGTYEIFSEGVMDTYGMLYNQTFYPRYIFLNLIDEDDDGNDNRQFRLLGNLQTNEPYFLFVTTYAPNTMGAFTIGNEGPGSLLYKKFAAPMPNTTFAYSNYSSVLSRSVPRFCAWDRCVSGSYNYEALNLNVSVAGVYKITSYSSLDMVGYLYQTLFNPQNTSMNLFAYDNYSGGLNQFSLEVLLETSVWYVLVATTFRPELTGPFSISTEGPAPIHYTLL